MPAACAPVVAVNVSTRSLRTRELMTWMEDALARWSVDPRRLRQEYLENFNNFCTQLREQSARMNIDYHQMRTDEPVDRALGIYLSRRQARR